MNRIDQAFASRKEGEKLLNLFITAGYPTKEATVDLLVGMEKAGADMIELGMPFSDPLADGPTIQMSSNKAIANGTGISDIFEMVAKVREQSQIPIILMGYVNPVMQYGLDAFCKKAAEVGVDGLIIPDLIPEEAEFLENEAHANALHFIHLVAPNSTDERMKLVDDRSGGFVYCVSVTGVTGARSAEDVEASVNRFIDRVNTHIVKNPKMIGFGIKNYEDAMRISAKADGYIVGSALINLIEANYPNSDWMQQTFEYVSHLKHGRVW